MANPFAQFGDYRSNLASAVVDQEPVTLGYLTGLPDPQSISDPRISQAVKTALKRDPRTKLRALNDFAELLTAESVQDDAVHLAFVQLYAKFSIEVSPALRRLSHEVLGKIYVLLGKRSSKYLKYSVGPWIAGTFDPDAEASRAAQNALVAVFPDETKRQLLLEKMREPLQSFVTNAISQESVTSLSDERYTEPRDALAKYTRLVKTCVDIVEAYKWDLDILGPQVWKFVASSDAALSRATLQLACNRFPDIIEKAELGSHLIKALRRNTPVPIDLLRTLTLYTREHPEIWASGDAPSALATYAGADALRPAKFWPQFFNLVMLVRAQDSSFSPYKALARVVPRTSGDAEPEAWGCFVALSVLTGYKDRVLDAVVTRTRRPITATLQHALARQLARSYAEDDVRRVVVPAASDSAAVPLGFLKVLATARKFSQLLGGLDLPIDDLAELVVLDPRIPVSGLPTESGDETEAKKTANASAWSLIAVHSETVDPQAIVDALLAHGHTSKVLAHAAGLAKRGVLASMKVSSDPAEIEAAVSAVGLLVSPDVAISGLDHLADLALAGDEEARMALGRVSRNVPEFVRSVDLVREKLAILAPEDRNIAALQALSVSVDLPSYDELATSLTVAQTACSIYPVKLPMDSPLSADSWPDLVGHALDLVDATDRPLSNEDTTKLALIASAARGWAYTTHSEEDRDLAQALVADAPDSDVSILWDLTARNDWVAFHAAQVLWTHDEFRPELDRAFFIRPGARGALITQRGEPHDTPWYHAYQRQNPPWYMIDPVLGISNFSSDYSPRGLDDGSTDAAHPTKTHSRLREDDPVATAALLGWQQLPLSPTDFAKAMLLPPYVRIQALRLIPESSESVTAVINTMHRLQPEVSEYDSDVNKTFLSFAQQHPSLGDGVEDLLNSTSAYLPWIAVVWPSKGASRVPQTVKSPAAWAMCLGARNLPESEVSAVLDWIGRRIPEEASAISAELAPPAQVAGFLLVQVAVQYGAALRQWYRDIRDRQLRKRVDVVLSNVVVPEVMRQLTQSIDPTTGIAVVERLREVRAVREIDEDSAAEIVIILPEQYPAKPAEVELKNLGGVPEAKKRAWLLEARQKVAAGQVLAAMRAVLARLDAFLDGVEPCAICYSVVAENKTLPNKQCSQCSNIYHTDCLYRWFHSNKNKLCPMCRAPM